MTTLRGSQTFQFIIRIIQKALTRAGMGLSHHVSLPPLCSYQLSTNIGQDHQDLDSFPPTIPFADSLYIQIILVIFGLTIAASISLHLFTLQKIQFGFLEARKGGLLLIFEILVWASWIVAVYALWVKVKGTGCTKA